LYAPHEGTTLGHDLGAAVTAKMAYRVTVAAQWFGGLTISRKGWPSPLSGAEGEPAK
jgi:hypothetical protein